MRIEGEQRRDLDGLLDQSRAEATGAHANLLVRSVYDCANSLNIGVKYPLGFVVRVTDIVSGFRFFLTEIARECHGSAPSE